MKEPEKDGWERVRIKSGKCEERKYTIARYGVQCQGEFFVLGVFLFTFFAGKKVKAKPARGEYDLFE
ncbi:MAG: hypothetical protein H7X99_01550 [Saprospiraceae bacterium]|nr:hypothetical protein [Saprospiraceae bacterium]